MVGFIFLLPFPAVRAGYGRDHTVEPIGPMIRLPVVGGRPSMTCGGTAAADNLAVLQVISPHPLQVFPEKRRKKALSHRKAYSLLFQTQSKPLSISWFVIPSSFSIDHRIAYFKRNCNNFYIKFATLPQYPSFVGKCRISSRIYMKLSEYKQTLSIFVFSWRSTGDGRSWATRHRQTVPSRRSAQHRLRPRPAERSAALSIRP